MLNMEVQKTFRIYNNIISDDEDVVIHVPPWYFMFVIILIFSSLFFLLLISYLSINSKEFMPQKFFFQNSSYSVNNSTPKLICQSCKIDSFTMIIAQMLFALWATPVKIHDTKDTNFSSWNVHPVPSHWDRHNWQTYHVRDGGAVHTSSMTGLTKRRNS